MKKKHPQEGCRCKETNLVGGKPPTEGVGSFLAPAMIPTEDPKGRVFDLVKAQVCTKWVC